MTEPLTAADPGTIERELRIDAAPATVFSYFVDPERMVRWMGRTAELDPTPGGVFRIGYNDSDVARGTYVEIDPPRRVVFTWGWEAPGDATPSGASTVEVTLTPDGEAGTHLHLRHSGLPVESIEGHAVGWDQFLPNLVAAVGAPGA